MNLRPTTKKSMDTPAASSGGVASESFLGMRAGQFWQRNDISTNKGVTGDAYMLSEVMKRVFFVL